MKLVYDINDKPTVKQNLMFALQEMIAIMAATLLVPILMTQYGLPSDPAAALLGAGIGTLVYIFCTKKKSPVFLGSSFAFIGSMFSAFAGAATLGLSEQAGYWGLIIGALMAGLVYVIIAIIVKFCGVEWINKLMPPVIIGPTVAIIGLSLSGNAVGDLMKSSVEGGSTYIALICGLFTLAVTMLYSTYGKKVGRLIPFILGILGGYLLATLFAIIGILTDNSALIVINYGAVKALDFSSLSGYLALPKFTFLLGGSAGLKAVSGKYLLTLFSAYVPVAFVVFAEHLADHKNLSTIVGTDLLKEPGLTRTLLGDGVGTMVSTFFGGCPNTTYGESIGCVAITRNASTISIWGCAFICIIFSMISPLVALLETIPSCVMGGVCVALYGFIAVSGFKMFQTVDLNKNKNLFVASVIFITGVGGMVVSFGAVEIRTVACALILGILTNIMLSREDA